MVSSADKFFMKDHNVTYYIFTDQDISDIQSDRKIVKVEIDHMAFPFMSLFRYKFFTRYLNIFVNEQYIYYCDVDMLFVDHVGDEILGDLVATIHPGYVGKKGTPETRGRSTAFVSMDNMTNYYAGGFQGGKIYDYQLAASGLDTNINKDLNDGIIAVWYDESHWNYYLNMIQEPTVILNSSYCYNKELLQSEELVYSPKIIALDKDHKEVRS